MVLKLALVSFLIGACLGKTVPPFLLEPYSEPDSSEHGLAPGSQKTSCACGWANKEAQMGRIIGGTETQINEYPFMAGVASQRFKIIFCGGTIISEYHVLTAAHCISENNGKELVVILGEHDTIRKLETEATVIIDVLKIIEHEGYRRLGHSNDIALLVLKENIQFNKFVGPACLPRKPENLEGKIVKVMGWGRTSRDGSGSTALLEVNLKAISIKECSDSLPLKLQDNPPRQLCTWRKNKDSCKGDSGGPVVWLDPETNRYTLVGAVSYGIKCESDSPGVNTLIHYYLDWIDKHIQETYPGTKTCSKI